MEGRIKEEALTSPEGPEVAGEFEKYTVKLFNKMIDKVYYPLMIIFFYFLGYQIGKFPLRADILENGV